MMRMTVLVAGFGLLDAMQATDFVAQIFGLDVLTPIGQMASVIAIFITLWLAVKLALRMIGTACLLAANGMEIVVDSTIKAFFRRVVCRWAAKLWKWAKAMGKRN